MTVIVHSKPWIGEEEMLGVQSVLSSGMLLGGEVVLLFRRKLVELTGCENIHLTPSGRDAIYSALCCFGLEPGQGVVVQTYVCSAVIEAIRRAGLKPVFCDVDEGWVATPKQVGMKIDSSIGAILLAPPFGLVQAASDFRKFGLPILQDCCQASPLVVRDVMGKDRGDAICLSFDPTKYICAGAGGALLLPTDTRLRRQGGGESQSIAPFDELRAAVGLAQLGKIERISQRRRAIAEKYFADVPGATTKQILRDFGQIEGHLFRFVVRTAQTFERVASAFFSRGIMVRNGVDALAHRASGISDTDFPNSIVAFEETVSLPFYPALTDVEVQQVAATARSVLSVQ
jgi:perosamine synthetase